MNFQKKWDLIFSFYFRIVTGGTGSAVYGKFANAENNSIWNKLYKYHMTKESPTGVQKGTIQLMSNTTEKLTHYGNIPLINEYLNDTDRPCGIRLLDFM